MCMRTSVGNRKLVEDELTMTMKMKIVSLDEFTPKICFRYDWDPKAQIEPIGPKIDFS